MRRFHVRPARSLLTKFIRKVNVGDSEGKESCDCQNKYNVHHVGPPRFAEDEGLQADYERLRETHPSLAGSNNPVYRDLAALGGEMGSAQQLREIQPAFVTGLNREKSVI